MMLENFFGWKPVQVVQPRALSSSRQFPVGDVTEGICKQSEAWIAEHILKENMI